MKKGSYKHTLEARKNIGAAHKGNKHRLGKKLSKEHREKLRTSFSRHHMYLKQNSDYVMLLPRTIYRKLHARAYDYIYIKYGKKGINDYFNWFNKTFGGLYEGKRFEGVSEEERIMFRKRF